MKNKIKILIKGFAMLGIFGLLLSCGGGGGTAPPAEQGSFDSGTSDGWSATGLWHVTTNRASNGSDSMWYADEMTGTYDTGVANSGTLTSGTIDLGVAPSISFDYFLDNECTGSGEGFVCTWDLLIPQISSDGGVSWTNLAMGPLGVSALGFTATTIDLVAYASTSVLIRFLFETVDSFNNAFEGAYVDNIVLTDADYAPGFTVASLSGGESFEAAAVVTASIVLNSQPSGDVSVSFSSDNLLEAVIQGSATVTLNASNWYIPQTVSIAGVDDGIFDNTSYNIVTAPAVSSDPLYDTLDPADIGMLSRDTDTVVTTYACSDTMSFIDDSNRQVVLETSFPFAGAIWDRVFVGSNGYLTFGEGTNSFSESVSNMISFKPRIAGLYDDLNPSTGGTISCSSTAISTTISYVSLPEWLNTGANSFDITLIDDGSIQIIYGAISSPDGLAGISFGDFVPGLTDPGGVDLSANPTQTIAPLVYEQFTSFANDLSGVTLTFSP